MSDVQEGQGHVCELLRSLDDWEKITNWWECKQLRSRYSNIDRRTPKCMQYMDNTSAVNVERKKYVRLKYRWIIHPFSYIKFLWETLMIVIYGIAFFTIPFMISFVIMDYEVVRLDKVNIFIYTICWLDIIVTCITGYYDKKNMCIELRPLKIIKKYSKGYLLVDILSSLPYDHITLSWRKLPGNGSFHAITLINILPLLKLTRYPTLNDYIYQYFLMEHSYYQLISTFMLGFYLIIWFSCLYYLLPVLTLHFYNIPLTECDDCWMIGIEKEGLVVRFQHAFFIVLENLLASGYGVFPPKADIHVILNTVLMILGRFVECYIIIMFLHIKENSKAAENKYNEIINQIGAYAKQKQLPLQIKNRIFEYYNHRFKNSFFREQNILNNLSEQLRDEIAMYSCQRLVENVELFKNIPQDVLKSIVKSLKFELYLQNDIIIRAGTLGNCMFFLSAGTIAILTATGQEICRLNDGAHFGEIALLAPDQKRVASVIAVEVCEVYRLDRKDFRKCVAVYSELFSMIERIAIERIEKTMVTEEHHKRFIMHSSLMCDSTRKKTRKKSRKQ
ncbi:potassium/sodium hyperpolarization-activated cyclic nucleotide-gated channel 1-like [Vespa crabro]|uniref:potassium/sodium hyperpolarization-activated cyclic nucleotide-gated channel 1-like n=1 Tax=Vespa crabro TaxID=7445 RepID=UPI001EFF726C|nr:potassium/sodium hyperpolarization-activated cyclic nucleotide-gated channel 1-like [Vespa crabro]